VIQGGTEQQIYSDGNVHVSTTRLIVFGVTYPLSNVSSVRLFKEGPNNGWGYISVIMGFLVLVAQQWLWGILLIALGVFIFVAVKAKYTMLIGSAGGEKAALQSPSAPYVQDIVDKINEAIVARG
jgi:hypothetical protein